MMTRENPTEASAHSTGRRVAVTGATGYLGSHMVELLLREGYDVTAVVRNPDDDSKVAHLHTLSQGATHPLRLAAANLLTPKSHDEAFADCEAVFHMASSVRLRAKDPQRDIVDVAVKGTKNVLQSAHRAGSVRAVVLTSSVAAVTSHDKPEGHLFTEEDWNSTSTLRDDPYPLSKTLAERAAWDLHGRLPENERFRLVALNPVVVEGPLYTRTHYRSSPNIVGEIFFGKLPACPRLHVDLVDVRDVALAHLRALERPEAQGRYLLSAQGLWMQDIGRMLAPHFPGQRVRTRRLPDLALYAAALFDKRLSVSWVRRSLGRITRVDTSRARRDLGMVFRPVEETLLDTARSFLALGLGR